MSRFPFPIPFGWFQVGYDHKLANGEIKTLHYFGQELILWRDETGTPHLQDAYCPHMGAHIGVGGKVKGELVECPFHHWLFDGDGKVASIHYAQRLNTKACLRSYPLREHLGLLMAWYHPGGLAPTYELPDVPELDGDDYVGPISRGHRIKTAIQEMAENTVDAAHFTTIHNHPGDAVYDEMRFDGPSMIMRSRQKFPSAGGVVEGTLNVDTVGFGFSVTRYETLIDVCMLGTNVPIDERSCVQYFHVYYKNPARDAKIDRIGDAFVKSVNAEIQEDVPIWENKVYRETPALCDGDGPIMPFRQWAQQFYVTNERL